MLWTELELAASGTARVVVVSGESGIGKTALCRAAVERATGFRVLRAAGEEHERDLAYGVLDQLLFGVAPRPAAGLGPTPLAVGAALVQLVSDLEARAPLIIWVDDLQWVDPPSQRALLFLLRRLEADPALVLLCQRDGTESSLTAGLARHLEDPRRGRVTLGGLGLAALAELTNLQKMPAALPMSAVRRLRDHTGGNPLWFKALLREIPLHRLRDESGPLPAPESFAASVADRLRRLSDESRALVEASAVAGTECSLGLLADVVGLTDSFEALDAAVSAALLLSDGGHPPHVLPVHPLVRSAVYDGLPASRRSKLHAELAQRALTEHDRLRHEIAASPGYDTSLSERVAEEAAANAARGVWSVAAAMFRNAALLSSSADRRRDLLENAMAASLMSSDTDRASAIAEQLEILPPSPRLNSLLGWLAFEHARYDEAEQLLLEAVREAEAFAAHPVIAEATRILTHLLIISGRAAEAIPYARRGLEISSPESMEYGIARGNFILALVTCGDFSTVELETASLDEAQVHPGELVALVGRGNGRLFSGDYAGAVRDLSAVITACRAAGLFEYLCVAWGQRSRAQYHLGDWDAAVESAEQAVQITEDAQQTWATAAVHANASFVPSRRGDWAAAAGHVRAALEAAARTRETLSVSYAGTAAAVLAHSRGDFAGVLEATRPILGLTHRTGVDRPGNLEWMPVHAEALVRVGWFAEANEFISGFLSESDRVGQLWAMAAARRINALLLAKTGRLPEALTEYSDAEAFAEKAGTPFEAALANLQHGQALGESGQPDSALSPLSRALAVFSELGAVPFASLAVRESAASGAQVTLPRRLPASRLLTRQELAVSRLVGNGLSNRAIAQELFISAKTVEFHLGNVFRKLGVSSRTQLVRRLAEE